MEKDPMSTPGAVAPAGWARTRERGAFVLMRLMFFVMPRMARPVVVYIVHLIALYFFLFGRAARAASLDYLARVERVMPESGIKPTWRVAYRHFRAFGTAILDKLDTWTGRLKVDDVVFDNYAPMGAAAHAPRGVLVLGSHLGNLEALRALGTRLKRVKLNVLVHTEHADYFNRILRKAGASDVELVQVTQLDPAKVLELRQRIDRGEWVVTTADRVPVHGGRTVDVSLLGGTAPLPIGPYVMASVLECPVHLLFVLRRGPRNHVFFEPFAESIAWERSTRDAVIADCAQKYAQRLEHYLLLEPLQWFNFYRFWRD
jgi:predicted LPLAT superfamily acyltransferase